MTVAPVATFAAAVIAPALIAILVHAIAGDGRVYRSPGPLIILGLAAYFLSSPIEDIVETALDLEIASPVWRALTTGFLKAALPEEFLKLVSLLLWLALVSQPRPKDALVGAIGVAMAFAAAENANDFWHVAQAGELSWWFWAVIMRSFVVTPSTAADAFVVGVWAAVVIADRGTAPMRELGGALALVVLAHGLWDTAFLLLDIQYPGAPISTVILCLPAMLPSVLVQATIIVFGLRELRRRGIRLGWPVSRASL